MSYKTELQSNNADIQSLIDKANALPVAENLDTEITAQDDLITQINAALDGKITGREALEAQIAELEAQIDELNESWAGTLTFSGSYSSATYYTEAGCSLAVDKQKGMAFVTIQGGTSSSYENIYFTGHTLPTGVTALTTQDYGGSTSGSTQRYYTQVLTGITGKINVAVDFSSRSSSYDYIQAALTVTYA